MILKGLLTAASLYVALCVGLYFYQTRLIFKPTTLLSETPADQQLDYEEVWIGPNGEAAAPGQGLHGWWDYGSEGVSSSGHCGW
ncbi:MAG: hypothetical protein AAFZ80_14690, partial [Cyanobacteria bacterium P01_A01_bin.105]